MMEIDSKQYKKYFKDQYQVIESKLYNRMRVGSSRQLKLLLLSFSLIWMGMSLSFNLSQTDKHGNILSQATVNAETVIDFSFSPNTIISNCSSTGCSLVNPQQSTMRFLNMWGAEDTYTLQNATIYQTPGGVSRPQQMGMFEFGFQYDGKWVIVGVTFSNTYAGYGNASSYQLDLSKTTDSALSFLKSMTKEANNSTGIPLSAFNYMNRREYGLFYHVADSTTSATYLLNYFILSNLKVTISQFPTLSTSFPPTNINYRQTGDFLGYGSDSQGIFQTHLRQSYPLWTAMIGLLIYWIYYLTTELIVIECYDKRFQNNKWTCWSIYSLHYLGHQEYFTKLSRETMMLITFSWEALVVALLYSNITYGQPPVMIFWTAVVAMVTALPFPYVLGYFFLNKIYQKSLKKFDAMKKLQGHFNKKDQIVEDLQKQLDDLAQQLYTLYYWFYVIAFVFFVSFWTLAIHEMMVIPRQFYYLLRYWLASVFVAFGLQHLVIDPLMTLIFGNFTFYRIRGFYYNYQLGQAFKQLEE